MKFFLLVRISVLAAFLAPRLGAQAPGANPGSAVGSDAVTKLAATWNLELQNDRSGELKSAQELASIPSPDWIANWAKGVIHRLTSLGKPVEIQFTSVDGRNVDLREMKGKVTLVDFWATWCPPCIEALPKLKATYDLYHRQGLEVIGISWDSDRLKLLDFVAGKGIPWPQDFDGTKPGRWGETFGVGGVPFVLLVDKTGCLRFFSANTEDAVLQTQIQKLLAE